MKILEKLKEEYPPKIITIYHNNKPILSGKNLIELTKLVKEKVKNPSKDIKVYLVSFVYDENSDKVFTVKCIKKTIDTKSNLLTKDMDLGQMVFYTKNDLKKIGFKKLFINNIIKLIKDGDMPYDKIGISISEII
jgi:hypothetical protein